MFYMLTRGQYPFKWLWTYAGDNFFEAEADTSPYP